MEYIVGALVALVALATAAAAYFRTRRAPDPNPTVPDVLRDVLKPPRARAEPAVKEIIDELENDDRVSALPDDELSRRLRRATEARRRRNARVRPPGDRGEL